MELNKSREFYWSSESELLKIQELMSTLKSSDKVDINTCVVTDLDYFQAEGISIDFLKHCQLITDLQRLESIIREAHKEEDNCRYKLSKLEKMVTNIFRRWRGNTLNNDKLKAEIDERVYDEVMKCWPFENNSSSNKMKSIISHINQEIQSTVKSIVDKFINLKCDGTYDFKSLECFSIQFLENYYRTHRDEKTKNPIVVLINQENENVFMRLFKSKGFENALLKKIEEAILGDWIHAVLSRKYPKSVSSLDYYCWEIALSEVKASGRFCTARMDEFIKQSLSRIIQEWREGMLPTIPHLTDHLEKFLVDFHHGITRDAELDNKLLRMTLESLIAERKDPIINFIKKACIVEVDGKFHQKLRDSKPFCSELFLEFVTKMIQNFKEDSSCVYNEEFREISDNLCRQIIEPALNEAIQMDCQANNRNRLLNHDASDDDLNDTNDYGVDEFKLV